MAGPWHVVDTLLSLPMMMSSLFRCGVWRTCTRVALVSRKNLFRFNFIHFLWNCLFICLKQLWWICQWMRWVCGYSRSVIVLTRSPAARMILFARVQEPLHEYVHKHMHATIITADALEDLFQDPIYTYSCAHTAQCSCTQPLLHSRLDMPRNKFLALQQVHCGICRLPWQKIRTLELSSKWSHRTLVAVFKTSCKMLLVSNKYDVWNIVSGFT